MAPPVQSGGSVSSLSVTFAEPWHYVTFRPSPVIQRMAGDEVSYQVASKQELEVIYEAVQPPPPGPNRTVWLVLAGLVVLLALAATGLVIWQTGMLGGDSQPQTVSSSSSRTKPTTPPSPTSSSIPSSTLSSAPAPTLKHSTTTSPPSNSSSSGESWTEV